MTASQAKGLSTAISLRFPGQEYDAITGLHYNDQRDYDPTLGRYIQPDPIGLAGGINTYAYVGNRPTLLADAHGLIPNLGSLPGVFPDPGALSPPSSTGPSLDDCDFGPGTSSNPDDPNLTPASGKTYEPGLPVVSPRDGTDPLDPAGLNRVAPTDLEQQWMANTASKISQGQLDGLNAHAYQNLPHNDTGAQLPPATSGYTTYDVGPPDQTDRGLNRLVRDNGTGAMYYTNNHYASFYAILPAQ